jgi:hypothetical protein
VLLAYIPLANSLPESRPPPDHEQLLYAAGVCGAACVFLAGVLRWLAGAWQYGAGQLRRWCAPEPGSATVAGDSGETVPPSRLVRWHRYFVKLGTGILFFLFVGLFLGFAFLPQPVFQILVWTGVGCLLTSTFIAAWGSYQEGLKGLVTQTVPSAGLGGAHVLAPSGPIGESPATSRPGVWNLVLIVLVAGFILGGILKLMGMW